MQPIFIIITVQLPLPTHLIQTVYDQVLNATYSNRFNRFKSRIARILFNFIKKVDDPLVEYNVSNSTLLLPLSHNLPFILKNHPHYSSNLARLAKFVKQKYDDLHFIDVGANIGDSVAFLRGEAFFPILCIEGDQQFILVLEKNIEFLSEVYLSHNYLGETNKEIKAIIDREAGTAHLCDGKKLNEIISVKQLTDVLRDYPNFLKAKMLKIDTDGFDCKIIRGAIKFIQEAKPVIFFEYAPYFLTQQGDDGISIFKLFVETGYQHLLIYDNCGDLMLTCDVNNFDLLSSIHLYYSGHFGRNYCDICVFHAEDSDLFEYAKTHETLFFQELKECK